MQNNIPGLISRESSWKLEESATSKCWKEALGNDTRVDHSNDTQILNVERILRKDQVLHLPSTFLSKVAFKLSNFRSRNLPKVIFGMLPGTFDSVRVNFHFLLCNLVDVGLFDMTCVEQ